MNVDNVCIFFLFLKKEYFQTVTGEHGVKKYFYDDA